MTATIVGPKKAGPTIVRVNANAITALIVPTPNAIPNALATDAIAGCQLSCQDASKHNAIGHRWACSAVYQDSQ